MSRKRSRYRPRPVMTDPLSLLRPAPPAARGVVEAHFLTALDMMTRGDHPGVDEWRSLSDAINTVETLTLQMGRMDPAAVMPTVTAAIAAMVAAARRHQAGQRMGLDGAGITALRGVIATYCDCMDQLTEHEMATATRLTDQRIRGLRARPQPGHTVISL